MAESKKEDETIQEVDSWDELTVPELKEVLDERKIEYSSRTKKPVLVKLLDDSDAAEEAEDADDTTKKGEGERPTPVENAKKTPEEAENRADIDEELNGDLGREKASTNDTQVALEKGSGEKPVEVESSVDVTIREEYIRTYSKELHGEDYAELAKSFASKVAGRKVLPAGKITWLKVQYRARSKALGTYYLKSEVFKGTNFKNDALAFCAQVHGACIYQQS